MIVKIYWSLWAIVVAAAIILFAAGDFTSLVSVILGMFAFGLTFMGMMGVLPIIVSQPSPEKPVIPERVSIPVRPPVHAKAFGRLKSA